MIIAITGEKGETGKTTLAVNLTGMRASAGHDVILMDADRQGSASYWAEKRDVTIDGSRPNSPLSKIPRIECVQKFGATLYRTARRLSNKFEDVIIDLPSGERQEMRYVLDIADVVMVPLQPSAFNFWTIREMAVKVELRLRERPELRAYSVINRVPHHPRSRDRSAAAAALSRCRDLTYPNIMITDRSVIRRASALGLTIIEYSPPNQKTIDEFTRLYSLVFGPTSAERNGTHP